MADKPGTPDYYTVLQVHPNADQEVIEAAYRQLMKKHHPDVAGTDARLAEQHHQRAKVINQAHSVLRDPIQRRRYDSMRTYAGTYVASPPPPPPPPRASPADAQRRASVASTGRAAGTAPSPTTEPEEWAAPEELQVGAALRGPWAALTALYYLLPGPYEWEGAQRQELLSVFLIPPVGVAAFALATGRLAPWVGHSVYTALVAWGVLLLLLLPSWSALPRLAMAGAPSALLMSGFADGLLRQASLPAWLAWVLAGFLSLVLSARLYVFAVLPMLAACWVLIRLS